MTRLNAEEGAGRIQPPGERCRIDILNDYVPMFEALKDEGGPGATGLTAS